MLGTVGASLLGNMLAGKYVIRACEEIVRAGESFWYCLILFLILKFKDNIKMNLDSMAFIQEIIYQLL